MKEIIQIKVAQASKQEHRSISWCRDEEKKGANDVRRLHSWLQSSQLCNPLLILQG